MYLVDTSAWIEYLRDTGSAACLEVERLLRTGARVATTEPIVMELLAGASTPHALSQLQTLTSGLPLLQVDARVDYHDAAAIYRSARVGGHTVRKLIDCLIAAVALRNQAILLHRDADFDVIAQCVPLAAVSPA
ncbi:MAG: type II toxin-antitoxin system VapC family toxin [Streptomycetales bacterium]